MTTAMCSSSWLLVGTPCAPALTPLTGRRTGDRPGCFQLPQPAGAGCPDAARDPNRPCDAGLRVVAHGWPACQGRSVAVCERAKSIPEGCVPQPSSSPPPGRIAVPARFSCTATGDPAPVHRRTPSAGPGGPDPATLDACRASCPALRSRLLQCRRRADPPGGSVPCRRAGPPGRRPAAPTRRPAVSGRWPRDPRWRRGSTRPTRAGAPATGAWTWRAPGGHGPVRAGRHGPFAGRLAGRGVVVVGHGAMRTTYEPVRASVQRRRAGRRRRPDRTAERRAPTASRPPACTGGGCAVRSTSTP